MHPRPLAQSRPSLYFAAPLFSKAELDFNRHVAGLLTPFFDIYLPQEDGGLMVEMISRGMEPDQAANAVFRLDLIALNRCDLVLIVLDGRTVDEGAAFELGYAYASGKSCFGLQTDSRRLLPFGNNPMLSAALKSVFSSIDELLAWAAAFVDTEQSADSGIVPLSRPCVSITEHHVGIDTR